jgi:hypothetical protein
MTTRKDSINSDDTLYEFSQFQHEEPLNFSSLIEDLLYNEPVIKNAEINCDIVEGEMEVKIGDGKFEKRWIVLSGKDLRIFCSFRSRRLVLMIDLDYIKVLGRVSKTAFLVGIEDEIVQSHQILFKCKSLSLSALFYEAIKSSQKPISVMKAGPQTFSSLAKKLCARVFM